MAADGRECVMTLKILILLFFAAVFLPQAALSQDSDSFPVENCSIYGADDSAPCARVKFVFDYALTAADKPPECACRGGGFSYRIPQLPAGRVI